MDSRYRHEPARLDRRRLLLGLGATTLALWSPARVASALSPNRAVEALGAVAAADDHLLAVTGLTDTRLLMKDSGREMTLSLMRGLEGHVFGLNRGQHQWLAAGAVESQHLTGAVWVSSDGQQWTRQVTLPDARVTDVVEAQGALVAVGHRIDPETSEPAGPVAWHVDGADWDAAMLADALGEGTLVGVTTMGGELIALGLGTAGGAAWASADGHRWRRVDSGGLAGVAPHGLVVHDGRLVAIATAVADGTPLLLESRDASYWRATPLPQPEFAGAWVTDLALAGRALVVAGSDRGGAAALWHSDDLAIWRREE
ncbi:MAG: hypothetical protein GEU81_04840 [Nitriliruptorales bacterium]|nr:hypothetical protein [Nitriliruptorales bacterium]